MKTCSRTRAMVLVAAAWASLGGVIGGGETRSALAQSRPPVPPPAVTVSDDTPTLGEVLDRYLAAVGGREAVETLGTRIVRARIVTDLPTWEPPVHVVDSLTVYSKAPGRYLRVRSGADGTELDACDGTVSWTRGPDGTVTESRSIDLRDAWLWDPQFAAGLREHFPRMVLLGTAVLDGRAAHVVDIDGEHLHRLYFDAESGLLTRLGYNTTLRDYRAVDGVMLPFEVEYSRKGGASTFFLDSVLHGEPLDDALFAFPDTP